MITDRLRQLFETTIRVVFSLILILIVLGIGIGAIQLVADLWKLLRLEGITGQYIDLISDVLTLYVLVELSRSLIEYFDSNTLRMTFIVDAAIIFVIREVLIGLFKHTLEADMIYALSALILSLSILRIGSAVVHMMGKKNSQA
ncbi:MAG: uncharacterized membrane protein (DUF373 family) [Motiliproteus sp.]|jgi:uncharacterized membrane protein (DUF373 family)